MDDGFNKSSDYCRKLCIQTIGDWAVTDYTEVTDATEVSDILAHIEIPTKLKNKWNCKTNDKCEPLGYDIDMGVLMRTTKKLKK